MSTISPLGSYARSLSTLRTFNAGQERVDTLSRQLSSGKLSTDLKPFGAETDRLLKLRTELVQKTAFVNTIDSVTVRMKAADLALDRMTDLAREFTSQALMPSNPGEVQISRPENLEPEKMAIQVNEPLSSFRVKATYTVTAVPSEQGHGNFDITINDGLGGRSVATLNLDSVPPGDGLEHQFKISGGPGEGATLNLTFNALTSAAVSRFSVNWPGVETLKDRIHATMTEVRNLLNERVDDRYLFAGSRYGTEPVTELAASKQVSRVTLDGQPGRAGDRYQVVVNERTFDYVSTGLEPSMSAIASNLASQMITADPALPMMVTTSNGVITMTARDINAPFTLTADVLQPPAIVNEANAVTTVPTDYDSSPAAIQSDQVTLIGPAATPNLDIGDTFRVKVSLGDPNDPFNARYYQQHPDAPQTRAPYQTFEVAYTVTRDDYFNNGIQTVTAAAGQLATLLNAQSPPFPVTAGATNGVITLTANQANLPFATESTVLNGRVRNTATAATLPPDIESLSDTAVEPFPRMPFYDADFKPNADKPAAWDKATVTIDDALKVTYGITSTDPAFQRMVSGLRQALAAVERPGDYRENIEKARDLFVQSKDGLQVLASRNAGHLGTLETTKDIHLAVKARVTEQIAKIEGIDQTEVATRLAAATASLEASYTVSARTQQLRLINFLT